MGAAIAGAVFFAAFGLCWAATSGVSTAERIAAGILGGVLAGGFFTLVALMLHMIGEIQ